MRIEEALKHERDFYTAAHLSFHQEGARNAPSLYEFHETQYKRSLKAFKANPCWGTLRDLAVSIGKMGYSISLSCTLSYAQSLSCLQEDFEGEFLSLLEYLENGEV
jgi:hypothetical protein